MPITVMQQFPYASFVQQAALAIVHGKPFSFDRARVQHDLRCGWKELLNDIRLETNVQAFAIEEGFLYIIRVQVSTNDRGLTVLTGLPDLIEL